MPAAHLEVQVEPGSATDDGADEVSYLLAANPGEPARPVARAASGGELARAMLALRLVLTEAPPTLVFDEVDAGIGGEAGTAVGRLLADLGGRHQVLCVTHLAQVAAHADAQLVVEKREEGGRTVATVTPVGGETRLSELARMLGGVDSTTARRHAAELLEHAGASIHNARRVGS
jgi:DNA repair protein RecN (Recombination protein N)